MQDASIRVVVPLAFYRWPSARNYAKCKTPPGKGVALLGGSNSAAGVCRQTDVARRRSLDSKPPRAAQGGFCL
jgi:hypothetical protein